MDLELGTAKLRKVGINNLQQGVHPHRGLVWTDGQSLYLTPLTVQGTQLQQATAIKAGQFQSVVSAHWSAAPTKDGPCHLAVVHQNHVTVWRVSGDLPNLVFKQFRKINVRPIAQGCLWNPKNDILCLLSRHQCSFYFRHDENKGSFALPPLESGKISCGCWSNDGKTLVLCVGVSLLIYKWENVSGAIGDFTATAWRVPRLEGEVTSITPIGNQQVVLATEIPLESLCKQPDLFVVPDTLTNGQSTDDVVRPESSPVQNLLNLQSSTQTVGDKRSNLTLVDLRSDGREPEKLCSVALKGVLTPDILMFESCSQCVVVGSNSQSQLHIYALLESRLLYCGDVQLEKGQRPKGICNMPIHYDGHGAGLLVLIGKRAQEDATFLSSSLEADFQLWLKYIILKAGHDKHRTLHNGHGDHAHKKQSSLVKSESMKEHRMKAPYLPSGQPRGRSSSVKKHHASDDRATSPEGQITIPPAGQDNLDILAVSLRLPDSTKPAISAHGKMVEDLSDSDSPRSLPTESTDFASQKPSFGNEKLTQYFQLPNHSSAASNGGDSVDSAKQKEAISASTRAKSPLSVVSEVTTANSKTTHRAKSPISVNSEEKTANSASSLSAQTHPSAPSRSKTQGHRNNTKRETDSSLPSKPSREEKNTQSKSPREEKNTQSKSPREEKNTQSKSPREEMNRASSIGILNVQTGDKYISASTSSLDTKPSQESARLSLFRGRLRDLQKSSGSSSDSSTSQDVLTFKSTNSDPVQNDVSRPHGSNHKQMSTITEIGGESQVNGKEEVSAEKVQAEKENTQDMEEQIRKQQDLIKTLQRRLESLSQTVEESCCVFPAKYQDMSKPELIEVTCTKSEGTMKKKFLLDNGRIRLEDIKLAFSLATVELEIDGVSCVLGANIDGYIPMKFSPDTVLHVSGVSANTST